MIARESSAYISDKDPEISKDRAIEIAYAEANNMISDIAIKETISTNTVYDNVIITIKTVNEVSMKSILLFIKLS